MDARRAETLVAAPFTTARPEGAVRPTTPRTQTRGPITSYFLTFTW